MKKSLVKYLLCLLTTVSSVLCYSQQLREVPDTLAASMKKEDAFKYANDPSFWATTKSKSNPALWKMMNALLESSALKWVLFIFLAAVIAYVVYQIFVANNMFARTRRGPKLTRGEQPVDETPEDLDNLIEAAVAAREYRLAIRYFYLQTLSLLSARKLIQLSGRSTNYDYVNQMRTHPRAHEFEQLTSVYDYVWYGEFQPDEAQFEKISTAFNQFNKQL